MIVHDKLRFKETDGDKKDTIKGKTQTVINRKFDDYIVPEIVIPDHEVENGYFSPDIVHRFKE